MITFKLLSPLYCLDYLISYKQYCFNSEFFSFSCPFFCRLAMVYLTDFIACISIIEFAFI